MHSSRLVQLIALVLFALGVATAAFPAVAKGGGHSGHSSPHKADGVTRDSHGHIARSAKAKDEFKKSHPCPSTGKASGACPGYVIDHVTPLKRRGADAPNNMQWQIIAAARAKDRWE